MGVRQHASLYIESPHQYDLRSSLERDLDGLATLVEQLREHVGLASDCGDGATAELLAELLLWIERAVRTMDKYLADETLVRSDERGSQPAATGRR
jgi:DNA-binding ferritin-like protein